jgi:hypothetical protein
MKKTGLIMVSDVFLWAIVIGIFVLIFGWILPIILTADADGSTPDGYDVYPPRATYATPTPTIEKLMLDLAKRYESERGAELRFIVEVGW